MTGALRPVLLILGIVVAFLASAVLGVSGPAAPTTTVTTAVPPAPVAGGAVCVTGAGPLRTVADLLLVAPPSRPEGADVEARGVVLTLGGSTVERSAVGPLAAGALVRTDVELGTDGWLWTGWADAPLLAWQEWRTPGAPGQPGGAVASTCLPADAQVQTVLGLTTAGGDEALLRLANPFDADATFAITLVTPTTVLEPVALRNVSVRAGTRTTVRLNDHAPEEPDLAAVVTVGTGRLAVEGLQRTVAAIGGVDGLASVAPVGEPAVAWTVPWLPAGPDVDGAVWILNPSPRDVVVEVTVHTPEGASVPDALTSVDVGAGALLRVAVDDLVADDRPVLGLTLRSQTTGVLIGAGARLRSDDPARTGLVRPAASPAPDDLWMLAGVGGEGRRTILHVVNLSEVEVEPRIVLTTLPATPSPEEGTGEGATDGTTDGATGEQDDAPPADVGPVTTELSPPSIASGAVARIILPLDGAGAWSAAVSGGPGLVVARTTLGDDVLEPIASAGVPSRTWTSVRPSLVGRARPGWVTGLGTSASPRRPMTAPAPEVTDGG